jgi:hypothetical protein
MQDVIGHGGGVYWTMGPCICLGPGPTVAVLIRMRVCGKGVEAPRQILPPLTPPWGF